MRSAVPRLSQLFAHDDRLLILIDPDPDSIACALALKRILWHRLSSCVIAPIRPITRPQNQRMVRLLDIALSPLAEISPDDFNRKALVDNQPGHHDLLGGYRYDVIIDHHPRLADSKARFLDIRPEYGATSTILTEYLREAHIRPSLKLATALYYGIKTDTSNFERPAIEADVRAFHYLFGFTRRPLVRRLEFAEFNLPMMRYFQLALNRYRIRHNRLYSFLGSVTAPDILVMLAEFFIRIGEISWAIVAGIYDGKLVVIFRNDGLRKNAGRLAIRAFGKLGSAGGHAASARAEVPLKNTDMNPIAQWQEWQDYVVHRVESHGHLDGKSGSSQED
jgi:nanoRNase/pAp phosphatase (c-di-AMP/oligoRNAs hydrolase)